MNEAQERITRTALGLARIFGPMQAACLLAAAAMTLIRRTYGRDTARAFFEGIAEEIDDEESEAVN